MLCLIRKKNVPATPEEQVRQACIAWMVDKLGYPRSCFVVEKGIKDLPHLQGLDLPFPDRRLDILVYPLGKPLLIIECKAGKMDDTALRQLMGYRHWIGAPLVALAGKEGACTYYQKEETLHRMDGLPLYSELEKFLN